MRRPLQEPMRCLCTTSIDAFSFTSLNLNIRSRGPGSTSMFSAMPSYPCAERLRRWLPALMFGAVTGVTPTYWRSMNTCAPGTSLSMRSVATSAAVPAAAGAAGGAARGPRRGADAVRPGARTAAVGAPARAGAGAVVAAAFCGGAGFSWQPASAAARTNVIAIRCRMRPQLYNPRHDERETASGRTRRARRHRARASQPALQPRFGAGPHRAAHVVDLQLRSVVGEHGSLHSDVHARLRPDGLGHELGAGARHDPAWQHDCTGSDPAQFTS